MSSKMVPVNDLVTVDMIAERLNVGVARVKNQVNGDGHRRGPKFPAPIAGSGTRGVWLWPEVREWAETSRLTEVDQARRAAKRDKGMRRQRLPRAA